MSGLKNKVLRAIGLGTNRPPPPMIDYENAEKIAREIEEESRRNARQQTELQLTSLDDLDHALGIKMAIAGTLKQLDKDRQE